MSTTTTMTPKFDDMQLMVAEFAANFPNLPKPTAAMIYPDELNGNLHDNDGILILFYEAKIRPQYHHLVLVPASVPVSVPAPAPVPVTASAPVQAHRLEQG